jgi:hypothetical protein
MNSSVEEGMLIAAPESGGIYRSPICVSTSATPKHRADAKARAAAPVIGTTPICEAHSCCTARPLQGRWARRRAACASLLLGWFDGSILGPSSHGLRSGVSKSWPKAETYPGGYAVSECLRGCEIDNHLSLVAWIRPKRSSGSRRRTRPMIQIADNLAIQHQTYFNQIGAHPQNVKSHGREMGRHQPASL